jgi:hypothetical protein
MKPISRDDARTILAETIRTGPCKLALQEEEAITRLIWWAGLAARCYLLLQKTTAVSRQQILRKLKGVQEHLLDASISLNSLFDDYIVIHICRISDISPQEILDISEINRHMADFIGKSRKAILSRKSIHEPKGRRSEQGRKTAILILASAFVELTGRRLGLSKDRGGGNCPQGHSIVLCIPVLSIWRSHFIARRPLRKPFDVF